MEIKTLTLGDIAVNCYLLLSDKAAVVIDPGFYSLEAEQFLNDNKERERIILLTHAHFDHIGGALEMRQKTGVKIAVGERENESLADSNANLSSLFGVRAEPFSADILLADNQKLTLGDIEINVILTPGHTKGGVSYLINDILFSGDTLFFESIGRTDFPNGSYPLLAESIKRLYCLDDNTKIFPGHGGTTSVIHEKQFNPFVR